MLQELVYSKTEPTGAAVSCEVGGETVILDLASGQYFALNAVGSAVWRHLQTPRSVTSLCDLLMEEYDVEPARCQAEVAALLEQLAERGLVRLSA